jgi:Plasmid pRiA4b ORF-3-like protein
MGEIARLSVEIDDVTPRVVRIVEVSTDIRLDDLHFVLQIAIGWQNGHPFEFRTGDKLWGQPDRDAGPPPCPPPQAGEGWVGAPEQSTLRDILAAGDVFKYDYVLGEDWEHTVSLLAREPAQHGVRYPNLVSAEGRCPPADIGGPVGYETYLRSIADPNSVDHEDMLDFDAPDFDPHVVDTTTLRKNLAELTRYIGRKPLDRHPEAAAQRPSKGDGPGTSAVSFEARFARTSG